MTPLVISLMLVSFGSGICVGALVFALLLVAPIKEEFIETAREQGRQEERERHRRAQIGEAVKMQTATFPEGGRICVRRPAKPELAVLLVQLVRGALGSEDPKAFDKISELCGPYMFVGYLAADSSHTILDIEGQPVGTIQPGDSITDEEN